MVPRRFGRYLEGRKKLKRWARPVLPFTENQHILHSKLSKRTVEGYDRYDGYGYGSRGLAEKSETRRLLRSVHRLPLMDFKFLYDHRDCGRRSNGYPGEINEIIFA